MNVKEMFLMICMMDVVFSSFFLSSFCSIFATWFLTFLNFASFRSWILIDLVLVG